MRNVLSIVASVGSILVALSSGCHTQREAVARAYCDESGCYQCGAHAECWPVAAPACSPGGTCTDGATCTQLGCLRACGESTSCDEGSSCLDGLCVPEGFDRLGPLQPTRTCATDDGCPKEQYCGPKGTCILRCSSDEQCGPGLYCQSSCGKCQPKGVPATCGSARVFCSGDGSCGAGKSCAQGRCHFRCDGVQPRCPVGQVCRDGLCADDLAPREPQCALDLHCGSGQCINGACHASCESSATCGFGSLCSLGVCQPDYHPAAQ